MKTLRKSSWNTYRVCGYTYDVANDQASAGGVHLKQVRLNKGEWQYRICQSNGNHTSYSETEVISIEDGLQKFEQAKSE
jgi:hypothetical protein